MVVLSFAGLFKTTSKGLPNLSKLPSSIQLSKSFFIYSTILQSIILLIFMVYFALSIFRFLKKIKNHRFKDAIDPLQKKKLKAKKRKRQHKKVNKKQEQRLEYPFNDQDEEFEERSNKIMNENNGEVNQKDNFDTYHDENERPFLKLDCQITLLQIFLVSFIVCNNAFATDVVTLCFTVLTCAAFLIFNIKGFFKSIKLIDYLFIVFSLMGYISFFNNDHDPATI